ncbi:MAG TPA: hypothetical protein VI385_15615 [Flavisolibacter sp.]
MRKIVFLGLWIVMTSASMAQKSKSVFLEVGGNGGLLSVNFDSRLSNGENGLGYRAGLGFIPANYAFFISRPTIGTIPVGLNYLIGSHCHYLETGLGLTYYFFRGTTSDVWGIHENNKGDGALLIPSIGYRIAPMNKGLQGRLFMSPLISTAGVVLFWGFSLGYKFL